MYDAIVVGARCAGSPTAMLLARRGYRVLLVDRAAFPSDITSTHYIQPPGVALLKRWGLLERLKATNCPPIRRITFDVGPIVLQGFPPCPDGIAEAYCPRRTVLDKLLLDAAAEAGVEVRERFSVEGLTRDGERVSGIQGRSSGATVKETARVVIGADGMHSLVAREVQAPEYNVVPPLACFYLSYWSGVPARDLEWYPRESVGHLAALFPTNDGMICLTVARRNDAFAQYRSDIEGSFLKGLELIPQLAERVRQGKREESYRGMGDLPNFFRKPFGPGWALVGDAGYHKDPITGQGITDAFEDAELLARAIDAGFSGSRDLSEVLTDYEQQRNQRVLAMYAFTCQMAALQPLPAVLQQLFAALRGNQVEIENFFGTFAGTVSIPEFFAPPNVGRIIAAAGAQAASTQTSTRGDTIMQSEFADVNGVRLHYKTAGQGKLIMFLHGFPEFWYEWKKQLADFSCDHQAVAPDMRGYNLSAKPADVSQYELKLLVEDVRALADHLGHERFVLAGHDWGGVVAWAFAAAHPERLERLIIINAPHPAVFDRELQQNPAQQQASQYMLTFRTPAAEQMLSAGNFFALQEAILQPGIRQGYFGPEDREAYLQAWSQAGALTGGLNYYRAAHAGPPAGAEQRSETLAAQVQALKIKVPTLVIWGEQDPYLLTGNLNGLEQFVPELTVRRVPDGSHWVIHEKPELINSYIREFIASAAAIARTA